MSGSDEKTVGYASEPPTSASCVVGRFATPRNSYVLGMSNRKTFWPSDGRRERARELIEIARRESGPFPTDRDLLVLRELAELSSTDLQPWLIQSAINAVELSAEDTIVAAAEREIEKQIRSGVRPDPDQKFMYYIPLQIVLNWTRRKPTQFFILGKQIFLRSKKAVQRDFRRDLDQTALIPLFERGSRKVPPTIATARARAEKGSEGWVNEVSAPFNVLRALLELVTSDLSQRSAIEAKPCAIIPHPQTILWIDQNGKESAGQLAASTYRRPFRHTFSQDDFDRIRSLSDSFASVVEEGSTAQVVSTALLHYGHAMDAQFNYTCFLSLWQCLEVLTLPGNKRGNTRDITSRANWILRSRRGKKLGAPKTFRELAQIRNRLVHEGQRKLVNAGDANVLKDIVEHILFWYLEDAVSKLRRRQDVEALLLRVTAP